MLNCGNLGMAETSAISSEAHFQKKVESSEGNAEGGSMIEIPSPAAVLSRKTAVVMGALLVFLSSCMQGPADPGSIFHKGIQRDAWKTISAYNAAALAHREKLNPEIPPAYWDPGIQRLHPVKVYTHRANLVVVQHMSGGNEKGKYIYLPVSSFQPVSSWLFRHPMDGFLFRPAWGKGEFNFTRMTVPSSK